MQVFCGATNEAQLVVTAAPSITATGNPEANHAELASTAAGRRPKLPHAHHLIVPAVDRLVEYLRALQVE
jgi:hypothetical protein